MSYRKPQLPLASLRLGNVEGACWRHVNERDDGSKATRYSYRAEKHYYDADTKSWSKSDYFDLSDLSNLIAVTQQLFDAILQDQQAHRMETEVSEADAQPTGESNAESR